MSVQLRPVTRDEARAFIRDHHRHHGVPLGWLWLNGAHNADGQLAGVAVSGRPVSRGLDDGFTTELTRMCTVGEPNAPSLLYGAARRAAIAKGYRRGLTYILDSEYNRFDPETGERIGGRSLEAAGWHYLWRVPGRSWSCKTRPREDKHPTEDKHAFGWGAWRELQQAEVRHVV